MWKLIKRADKAILIYKIDFRSKNITVNKEDHFITISGVNSLRRYNAVKHLFLNCTAQNIQ